MTTATEKITVYSDDGDRDHPASIEIIMDTTQQACPITFWQDEKAVFSMGNDELPTFIKALTLFDCSNTIIPQ